MSDPKLTDVLWIHSRLHRPPYEYTQSWAVLHATRQIAKAVRTGIYPHHLEVSRQPYAYGKQHHARAAEIFSADPVLERMADEAARSDVLWIPPGWDLDPIGDWIAHVAVVEPRVWDKILRMDFGEIDRRQRVWHLGLANEKIGVAEPAEIVHRYADGWTWALRRLPVVRRP